MGGTDTLLDDEPWSLIPGRHYWHRCCACGETHRLTVEVLESEDGEHRVVLKMKADARRTAAYRREHPELPAKVTRSRRPN